MFWPAQSMLICSDLHIGKGGHFRKNGIAIPTMANKNNFWNLSEVFHTFKPAKWLVVGDLVHSTENKEWDDFIDFLDNYPSIQRILVKGNHEIYTNEKYTSMGFEVLDEWIIGPFHFTHDPIAESQFFNISGHIHPAVRLIGAGRQSVRAACFYFNDRSGLLPACGEFTGTSLITPKKGDRLFVIANNKIIEKS